MKKSFLMGAAALLLSVAGLTAAHVQLTHAGESLRFPEKTYLGDRSILSDLTLEVENNYVGRLFWDSTLTLESEPETEFRLVSGADAWGEKVEDPPRIWMQISVSGGADLHPGPYTQDFSGFEGRESNFLDQQWDYVWEVAEKTPADGTYTEAKRFGDYYEAYLPEIKLQMGDVDVTSGREDWYQPDDPIQDWVRFVNDLRQAFRFPVLPDHTVEVKTGKTGEFFTDVDVIDLAHWPQLWTFDHNTRDTVYFVPMATDGETGQLMDYALTPAGYGVYSFPMGEEAPTLADLKLFTPLDEEERLDAMTFDADLSHMLLILTRGEEELIRILDLETGEMEIDLSFPNSHNMRGISAKEDLVLYAHDRQFDLFRKQNGGYVWEMTAKVPESFTPWTVDSLYITEMDFAYDGSRLAVFQNAGGRRARQTGVSELLLMAFEDGTPIYCGTLQNELTRGLFPHFYEPVLKLGFQ